MTCPRQCPGHSEMTGTLPPQQLSTEIAMTRPILILAVAAITTPSFAADAKRPNILFAFADDWGRYASIYAETDGPGSMNDVVRTPTFDRLAKEGVLFRRAFVSAP